MAKKGMWIPLMTSVGVGAATFYTMTKNSQSFGQTMGKMLPFVSQMGSGQQSGSQNMHQ